MLDIGKDLGALQAALAREAIAAVKQDGADAIVLGCTGFLGCAGGMRKALLAAGCDVPVIDPIPLAVQHGRRAGEDRPLAQQARLSDAGQERRSKGYPFPEFNAGG